MKHKIRNESLKDDQLLAGEKLKGKTFLKEEVGCAKAGGLWETLIF